MECDEKNILSDYTGHEFSVKKLIKHRKRLKLEGPEYFLT